MPKLEESRNLPKTAYLFIHHRQLESIQRTIFDFYSLSRGDSQYVLVDNSEDLTIFRSIQSTLKATGWPVDLIAIENRGYGQAANFGIEHIREKYPNVKQVFIVTHDVRYVSGKISTLTELLDSDTELAVIGPRVVNREFFSSQVPLIWSDGGRLTSLLKRPVHINFGRTINVHKQFKHSVWLDGCFLAIDLKKIKDTRFDENYFMYFEDVDFCMQISKARLQIGHTTEFVVSQESFGVPNSSFRTNYLYFMRKYFPHRVSIAKIALFIKDMGF